MQYVYMCVCFANTTAAAAAASVQTQWMFNRVRVFTLAFISRGGDSRGRGFSLSLALQHHLCPRVRRAGVNARAQEFRSSSLSDSRVRTTCVYIYIMYNMLHTRRSTDDRHGCAQTVRVCTACYVGRAGDTVYQTQALCTMCARLRRREETTTYGTHNIIYIRTYVHLLHT